MKCLSCKSLSGEKRISPGPTIYEGKYWVVEHAYPVKLLGWLVIVLKRHLEAVHNLTIEEMVELGQIINKTTKLLHSKLKTEKEYVACFAESEGFSHVHFHIVPRTKDFPKNIRGSKSFSLLSYTEIGSIQKDKIIELCEYLKAELS